MVTIVIIITLILLALVLFKYSGEPWQRVAFAVAVALLGAAVAFSVEALGSETAGQSANTEAESLSSDDENFVQFQALTSQVSSFEILPPDGCIVFMRNDEKATEEFCGDQPNLPGLIADKTIGAWGSCGVEVHFWRNENFSGDGSETAESFVFCE